MPRIADHFADCSVFIYESEVDALEGSKFGGSGFLVHVPSEANPEMGHIYAVTNRHVINGGCGVLRLSRKDGGIDTIPTRWGDWFFDLDGDDLAVLPLDIKDFFRWWSVSTKDFVTRDIIAVYRIGYGDEAFLVGRLINHAGEQKNAPVTRFGNISLMADPTEPIKCEDGREQEGFLVECRSLSGFSGSPVFVMTSQVYYGESAERLTRWRQQEMTGERAMQDDRRSGHFHATFNPGESGPTIRSIYFQGTFGPWLLGIDWGHIPFHTSVHRGKEKTEMWVESNTGIACVLPAWHILETLNREELVKERKQEDKKIKKRMGEESAVNDLATRRDEPFTKEHFENALKKASRKIGPPK